MKLKLSFLFAFILVSISLVSALEITEIELNPEGSDFDGKFIELYSEQEINISNIMIMNNDGDSLNLTEFFSENFSFSDYLVIEFGTRWLYNSDEKVFLYVNGELKDETPILEDGKNDLRTWQLCSNWTFVNATKDSQNLCQDNEDDNNEENEEENEDEQEQENQNIEIDLDYPDEVYYDEEFEVELEIQGLEYGVYDVKIVVTSSETISKIYDFNEDEWISGYYYVKEGLEVAEDIEIAEYELVISKEYLGEADITVSLRKTGESSILATETFDIELEEKIENDDFNEITTNAIKNIELNETDEDDNQEQEQEKQEVVYLNQKSGKNQEIEEKKEKDEVLFVSSGEKLKNLSIYGFAGFCILLLILIIMKKNF